MLLTRSPLNWSRSPSRVRLACVRHAASVDSEPGSNSHVNLLLRGAAFLSNCATAWQLVNASADDLALALFVLRVGEWFIRLRACARRRMPLADTRRAVQLHLTADAA